MATDLGTYYLIGPNKIMVSTFLYSMTGGNTSRSFFRDNQLIITPGLHCYTSKVLQSRICLLEVPGFNDDKFELSDSELLCLLQHIYFRALSKGFKPKGFIVIEAIITNQLAIFSTLDRLFSICGSKCKSSTLVMARRIILSNKVEENNIICERCEKLDIPYTKWSHAVKFLLKEDAAIQLSNLISALNRMEPYYATWMTELEEEIKISPRREAVEERNINVDSESDDSEVDFEEVQNKNRSVLLVGFSIYYVDCILTRPGVINASRNAFGLEFE